MINELQQLPDTLGAALTVSKEPQQHGNQGMHLGKGNQGINRVDASVGTSPAGSRLSAISCPEDCTSPKRHVRGTVGLRIAASAKPRLRLEAQAGIRTAFTQTGLLLRKN